LTLISRSNAPATSDLEVHRGHLDFFGSSEPKPGVDVRDVISFLSRNWRVLALCAGVGAILGVAVIGILPPRYSAEGLVVIDTREINIPEFQSIRSARTVEPWGGKSEARVLGSHEMIATVAEKLDLKHDPHFNPTLKDSAFDAWLRTLPMPQSWRDSLKPEPRFDSDVETDIVNRVAGALTISSEERSYAINLRYVAYSPELAAKVVNVLMDNYLDQDIRAKRRTVDQARTQLKDRLDALRTDLTSTWGRIRSLESQQNSLQTQQGTLNAQQVVGLNNERLRLQSKLMDVQADLGQIDSGLVSNHISVTNDRLVSQHLKSLWQIQAELQSGLAKSSFSATNYDPRIQQMRSSLSQVQQEIRNEVTTIRNGLRQRQVELTTQDDTIEKRLATLGKSAAESAVDRAQLDQLHADVLSKQALFDQYQNRYEQTVTNADLVNADARIASYADAPTRPAYPGGTARGAIGALLGFAGCLALLTSRRWLQNRIDTLDEAERITGVPALAGIPEVGSWKRQLRLPDVVLDYPHCSVTSTIRAILYHIAMARSVKPMQVVMVTSPSSSDGKSSLVASLARVAARDGLRCLVLECDFFRPNLASTLALTPTLPLNRASDEQPQLSDMLVNDPASGADFVLAEPSRDRATGLPYHTQRLRHIIEAGRDRYDLVLLDTPPAMAVVDPMLLSQMVDGMLVVLPWRKMTHRRVRDAMQRIGSFACPTLGVVLSRVPAETTPIYSYSGYEAPSF
jgi:polysaccharide biosynthesis transport protein